ncbi:helix-turn-helix transcriptional regulator [Paenibacillus sp. M1]|uniref:Helix-turn-helix transcriptional regulator n=1 Tax=Paenibacillus haidiansis TaxID=1574488 RepID=A0ABU7VRN8_9BACL
MISATTIRAEMEDHIKREGITLHHFAELSGVNVGTLSGIINGNRPISVGQLDLITTAMGFSEGYFYDLYADECFVPTAPHWRRMRPFLLRCAELKRHDCIEQVLTRLLDDLKQVGGIFETAELMFEQGWKEAAVILYESVIESERSNHSERLAMSYYRLFQIHQGDGRKGYKAAMQFLPYRYRLPESYALDGLLMLAEVHALKFNWSEVEIYVDELRQLALALYNKKAWQESDFNPARPLVYYYGRALLIKSGTYEYRGLFEECKKLIPEYADLSWFEGLDEDGKAEVKLLKMFARANYLCVDIKAGNRSLIPDYVRFLEEHPDEIIEGLITLIESANRHQFFIDDILTKYSAEIEDYKELDNNSWFSHGSVKSNYKESTNIFRCSVFFRNFALYHFRKGLYEEGLDNILYSILLSLSLGGKELIVTNMAIFELHREYSSEAQRKKYSEFCRKVWENEKQNVMAGFGYAYA